MTLGRFVQRVFIDGYEVPVRDCQVQASSGRVSTIDFMVERDVAQDALFDYIGITQRVVVEQTVDYPGLVEPVADASRTLVDKATITEICETRLGGGADGKRVTAETNSRLTLQTRVSGVWPHKTPNAQEDSREFPSFDEPFTCGGNTADTSATAAVSDVLGDLASAMGVNLRIESGGSARVERVTATHDTVADVLDELQRRTGSRWEVEDEGGALSLVWFDPFQRTGPDLDQDQFDIVDGTLRVCTRGGGIVNAVRAAGWEYADVVVQGYGKSPFLGGDTMPGRTTVDGEIQSGRPFSTVGSLGAQRQHFIPFQLDGSGWEVVGQPCVRAFTANLIAVYPGSFSSGLAIGYRVDYTEPDDSKTARVHMSERMVEVRPNGIDPGGRATIAFRVRRKVWVESQDDASIAKYGRREGEALDDNGGRDIEAAFEEMQSYLSRKAGVKYQVDLETTRFGFKPNTVISVRLTNPSLERTMFVKEVTRSTDGVELTTKLKLADQELVRAGVGADVSGAIWPDTGEVDFGEEIVYRLKRAEKSYMNPASPGGAAAREVGTLKHPPFVDRDSVGWGEVLKVQRPISSSEGSTWSETVTVAPYIEESGTATNSNLTTTLGGLL